MFEMFAGLKMKNQLQRARDKEYDHLFMAY